MPVDKKQKLGVVHDEPVGESDSKNESLDETKARELRVLEATLIEILAKRGTTKTC